MNRIRKTVQILLVEDNGGDVLLVREGLKAIEASVILHVVMDGIKAMEFVRKQTPRPDLIILDMNLPFKSGREVLEELKADADLREIPVVVFTSSASLRDIRAAYRLQASSYVRKPEDVDEFFRVVAGIERYWTETALLPSI